MNAVRVSCQLEHWEKAQNSYPVGSIKHLRFKVDLELFRHFCELAGDIIVVVLRLIAQAIQMIVQGGL